MASMEKKDDIATTHNEAIDVEKPGAVQRDYSGAAITLDPVEQKLVRKLDIRIMVCYQGTLLA